MVLLRRLLLASNRSFSASKRSTWNERRSTCSSRSFTWEFKSGIVTAVQAPNPAAAAPATMTAAIAGRLIPKIPFGLGCEEKLWLIATGPSSSPAAFLAKEAAPLSGATEESALPSSIAEGVAFSGALGTSSSAKASCDIIWLLGGALGVPPPPPPPPRATAVPAAAPATATPPTPAATAAFLPVEEDLRCEGWRWEEEEEEAGVLTTGAAFVDDCREGVTMAASADLDSRSSYEGVLVTPGTSEERDRDKDLVPPNMMTSPGFPLERTELDRLLF
mmetsp:Transcript_20223/g.43707  ORF Transcript_20223/g.43707 Transcript_20223/m.43707 type:complete len:276 (+) Transcript_20223:974-1801(+)